MKLPNPRGLILPAELVPGVMAGTVTMFSAAMKQANDHGVPAGAVHPARESGWIAWWPGTEPGLAEFTKREYLHGFPCPYRIGERRYIKEAWYSWAYSDTPAGYLADEDIPHGQPYRIRSARTMPREHARTWVEILSGRPARCRDITEEEALASGVPVVDGEQIDAIWCPTCRGEGVHGAFGADYGVMEVDCSDCDTAVKRYSHFWDAWNAKRGFPWSANPWVWRCTFRLTEKPC